ncbi:MAG: energy transducer TonB [Gammaproteobacteria bacterium]|nr:energy transducer TonB [Gammaproteobacteria bacterium]
MRRIILIAGLTLALSLQGGCVGTSNQPFSLVQPGTLEFPQEARDAGETQGSVVVEYDIEVDGTVSNLLIVSSDPPELFDEEALRFVGAWRFRPAYEDGNPVATRGVQSTIRFELSNEEIELPDL